MVSTSNIEKILESLGIPQSEMANKLGMSRQQLNNIVNGRGKFTYEQLADLHSKYNVNLNFLITGKGEMYCSEHIFDQQENETDIKANYACKTDKLTKREEEIMSLMLNGLNNKEIAENMFISSHTVKAHLSSIMYKLKAKTRTEAVVKYITIK